jgi:hypothetical protein
MTQSSNGGVKKLPGDRYIPCRVEPGMFRGEYLAFLEVYDPEAPRQKVQAQALVDEREVSGVNGTPRRNAPVSAWLRVELVGRSAGLARVALPQPAQPVGENALVEEAQLLVEVPG